MDATRKSRSPEIPPAQARDPLGLLAAALHAAAIGDHSHLCLAFSGGLDSTALLHALHALRAEFGYRLSAVHVDHGLQAGSAAWSRHCAREAAALDLPLQVLEVEVAPATSREGGQGGLEAAARGARHAALAGVECDRMLLAHHRDDQAETVLLALLRGSGPAGLAAMGRDGARPGHPLADRLLRPWLDLDRSTLHAWALDRGLEWIEDPSNRDTRLDRNFLRHRIGPLLNGRFPGWRVALARSAGWAAEAQQLLEQLAAIDLAGLAGLAGAGRAAPADPAVLPMACADLLALPEPRARNLLRMLLAQRGVAAPPAARLADWTRQLAAAADRQPELRWGGQVLRRWGGWLWLEPCLAEPAWPPGCGWDGLQATELHLADGGRLSFSAEAVGPDTGAPALLRSGLGYLTVAACQGSARLRLYSGGPSRELRKLFQEAGVPPWRRRRMPALYAGRALVAVAGLAVDAGSRALPGQAGWRVGWVDAGTAT